MPSLVLVVIRPRHETAALVRATGSQASVHVGDVAADEAIEGFVQAAAEAHGGIDVVVNNAGVMREVRIADMPPAEFRRVVDVNLVAHYVLARAAYPELRRRGGVIVNIGSLSASSEWLRRRPIAPLRPASKV